MMYPVGSIYTTLEPELPSWFRANGRVWERVGAGRCLWGAKSDNSDLGKRLGGILPEHNHAYSDSTPSSKYYNYDIDGTGTRNSAYSNSEFQTRTTSDTTSSVNNVSVGNTLRPPALGVVFWQRTN